MRIERYTDGTFKKKINLKLHMLALAVMVAGVVWAGQTKAEDNDSSVRNVCMFVNEQVGGDLGLQVCAGSEQELLELVPKLVSEQLEAMKENTIPREERDLTIIKTLKRVCQENGVTNKDCPRHLYGMARQESILGKRMVGDGGLSHGWYHIMGYHHVPKVCSHDLECSADWTLKRMVSKGYNDNPDNAIRLHNGSLVNPKTLEYLKAVKSKMY